MIPDWSPDTRPDPYGITPAGWLRVVVRGVALISLLIIGLTLLLIVRLFERPLFGLHRPVTPYITQMVCRISLVILGLGLDIRGAGPMRQAKGAIVANHSSWLDIFVLNASSRVYFVAKSEVSSWVGIGWLARATGTVFIRRARGEARLQKEIFENRLNAGHRLLFFPEGTSTDGLRVLPFKSTLFAAFFVQELSETLSIQPVSVSYRTPPGTGRRFYGWWGDTDFAPHLIQVLSAPRGGGACVEFHPTLRVADFADRKALAKACEAPVRSGVEAGCSA